MWELDHKESWALKHWCFWTVVLEKILESPLHSNEIKPANPKLNQSWIFIGRTDTPILWPPDEKSWLIGKDPDDRKIEGRRRRRIRGWDEMVGWHHQLYAHEFEQAPGVGNRQGSLVCCSLVWSLGHRELDMAKWLSWTGSLEAPLTIPKWILCKCPNQWTIIFFQFYLPFLRMTQCFPGQRAMVLIIINK